MQKPSVSSPSALIAQGVINYIAAFVSLPAIVLHGVGIIFAAFSLYLILLAWNPAAMDSALTWLFFTLKLENFSYQGNPTSTIIAVYGFASLVVSLVMPRVRRIFTFKTLMRISAVEYSIMTIALSIAKATIAPAIFLFVATTITTAIAFGASRVAAKTRLG